MINIFETHPEFINLDHRASRPGAGWSYIITPEFMYNRHRVMLPADLIQGKTILDIGSCLGATGDWCLANGATHYTGLEVQDEYVELSNRLLLKYNNSSKFDIIKTSFEHYSFDKQYDIVVASGVLYGIFDPYMFVNKITSLATTAIIIESAHPYNAFKTLFPRLTPQERYTISREVSLVQIIKTGGIMIDAKAPRQVTGFAASVPSVVGLSTLFKNCSWEHDTRLYDQAEEEMPQIYNVLNHNRFMAKYVPSDSKLQFFYDEINNPQPNIFRSWNGPSTA